MYDNPYFKKRGGRIGYNLMKVSKAKNGQFSITIPKNVAVFLELDKGDVVHFETKRKVTPMFNGKEITEFYCIIKKSDV